MSVFSPRDVEQLLELGRRQLEELARLRREAERQTDLLERLVASIQRLEHFS